MQETCRELEQKIKDMELTSVCVYCHKRLISDSTENKMKDVIEHMAECEKHPVPILLDKLAEIEKWFIAHKEHSLEIHNGWARLSNEGMFDLGNNEHFNKKIAELEAAEKELEELRLAQKRYEKIRMMSPRQFSELWSIGITSKAHFDDLVDTCVI